MDKIFVITSKDPYELDVMLADGGIASIHHNGEHFVTSYYQERATKHQLATNNVWDTESHLHDCKMYSNDWDANIKNINIEMIMDAAQWLSVGLEADANSIVFADYLDVSEYYVEH